MKNSLNKTNRFLFVFFNFIQQNQSDQIYRMQTNNPSSSSSNILKQTLQNNNTNSYPSSTLVNMLNKSSISQQRYKIIFNNNNDMSKVFLTDPQTGNNYPGDEQTITNLLRENAGLIRTIKELQNEGNNENLFDYMKQLHRNILWLSFIADESSTKTNK